MAGCLPRDKVFSVLMANRDTCTLSSAESGGDSEIDEDLSHLNDLKTTISCDTGRSPRVEVVTDSNSCDSSGSQGSLEGVREHGLDDVEMLSPCQELELSSRRILKIPKTGDSCHEPPPGEKINLAEIQAHIEKNKKVASKMPRKDSTKERAIAGSQELQRRRKSPRPSDHTRCSGPSPRRSDVHDRKSGGKRNDVVAGSNVDARVREVNDTRNPKKKWDDEQVVHLDALEGRHLFVEGVNHKNNSGSFWDLKDQEIDWRTRASLIGDHDRLHLLPQPTEVLTRSLSLTAFQILLLAHTFEFREERSQNFEKRLDEEMTALRGECKRLDEERAKDRDDFLKSQKGLKKNPKSIMPCVRRWRNLRVNISMN